MKYYKLDKNINGEQFLLLKTVGTKREANKIKSKQRSLPYNRKVRSFKNKDGYSIYISTLPRCK